MQQQIPNSQPMNCKKNEHLEQQFIFFKFSEKIEEILQCMSCSLEDPQVEKKMIIDQILKFPFQKIQNFPPLKDQKNCKEIKKVIEIFNKEKIQQFKEQVVNHINSYYEEISEEINQVLLLQKKNVIQQFENIMQFTDVSEFYDIMPVKEMIQKYQENEIDLEKLFEQQLKMKKSFEDEKKFNITMNQQNIQNEIKNQIENMKQQLDRKLEIFQEEIVIDTNLINQYQQQVQYFEQDEQQQMSESQKCLHFYKSNYKSNLKEEIQIKNNGRRIEIDNKTIKQSKQIYSEDLEKKKTYHLKMKINFHQKNKQVLGFSVQGSNDDKDIDFSDYNRIILSNNDGNCFARGGKKEIIMGLKFADFWKDNETILNLKFNYQKKLLEIFDEQRKGYVKSIIDKNKINGEKIILGVRVIQNYNERIDLNIVDFQCY
ncbi:hypothetical protein PPERSA_02766 [Pseudocohnilembus persalinus]|uniref:Uncharacterized protein n=1 Tax=Pseudocohnilembus persalinus TaxID=266149 RepID=A0A0V0Q8X8_PSEPJ|nr:hypothetical protein PPERSA_02766 [Pseudocohnilembus persalinus]|eukprot:KRW98618.1 hypothetical protein PPERSA_02766 [Pseudocohnilembus persalinus]